MPPSHKSGETTPIPVAERTSNGAFSIGKSLAASWDKFLFFACLLLLAYAAGVATAQFHLPPYDALFEIGRAGKDWVANWPNKLGIDPSRHLMASRHKGAGLVQHVEGESMPGVTLMESMFDDRVGLRLVDHQGNTLHTWDAIYSEIAPNTDILLEDRIPTNDWEVSVHGAVLYPNGDVVFNLSGITMVRMNACGEVVWKLPAVVHHSMHVAEDGNIWTLGRVYYLDQGNPKFPGMRPEFEDNLVLEVTPEGEILREISLLEILYANDLIGAMFPTGHELVDGYTMEDVIHTNDVEILSSADAPAFPLFEAGDALVSLRNLNLLIVFDPDTGVVKWSQTGPWLRQHDPDFLPDGRILVFDNRVDGANGRLLGGSRIVAMDPVTREVEIIYEGTAETPFYTKAQGKVDLLDNGNFLITESYGGRVFEVTPDGTTVWSFINRYDADRVLRVSGATRYPESFADFDRSGCS
jgi:Arylsulfotransferase (ASST)